MKKMKFYFTSLLVLLVGSILFARQSKETEPIKKPNILFCIADDATWKHMSAYGTDWIKTPAFDKIADQGLLFNNAYTPNAKCGPSRSIILTGRNTWQLEEAANHLAFGMDLATRKRARQLNGDKSVPNWV